MRLFSFGSNGSGQLGIGHQEDVSHPTPCLFENKDQDQEPIQDLNEEITQIAAGGNHTLLLTKSGSVYTAGCNTDGRCGSDPESHIFRRLTLITPESQPEQPVFTHVSATWEGSLLVASRSTADTVYVLGSGSKGELGTSGPCIPAFPPEGTRVVALASGMAHSVAVLSTGEVWGWGAARKGQLGGLDVKIALPVRIAVPFAADAVVCGREFTVVSGGRRFVVLGDLGNRWGILQVPDCFSVGLPGISEGCVPYPFTGIRASWHGIYVHATGWEGGESEPESGSARSGALVAWGRGDRGQIPPPTLPSPAMLAVGSEHVVALLTDGRVAACGWGEHGNCGLDKDDQGNVSGRYNIIPLPETEVNGKVTGVGAGCATSWIVVD